MALVRLTARGPAIVKDDAWIAMQSEFARRHCVVFKNFVEESILARVPRWCETSRWFTREDVGKNGVFARELTMQDSEPLVGAFRLLLNQPRLFAAMAEFTGSETPIRSFIMGRCFKALPGGEHFASWHDDYRERDRLYGLTINLSPNPFVGGHFQIRRKEHSILHTVTTSSFGDACLFRIHRSLEHRATTVRGVRSRYCFAGWFSGTYDYRDVFREAARPLPLPKP